MATLLKRSLWLGPLCALWLLSGCASHPADSSYQTIYRVAPGDTLSLIAKRHGVSVRDLVRWNDLDSPDFIVVGQKLRLNSQAPSIAAAKSPRKSSRSMAAKPIKPSQKLANWQWPIKGRVTSTYQPRIPGRHGILIKGQQGAPVKAAYQGQVIYSGAGALGQGYMLIVKHNNDTVTAYAHLGRVTVREGQKVRAGQTIGRLGGSQPTNLHFEVRRRGKTVNPLLYLT